MFHHIHVSIGARKSHWRLMIGTSITLDGKGGAHMIFPWNRPVPWRTDGWVCNWRRLAQYQHILPDHACLRHLSIFFFQLICGHHMMLRVKQGWGVDPVHCSPVQCSPFFIISKICRCEYIMHKNKHNVWNWHLYLNAGDDFGSTSIHILRQQPL